MYSTPLLCHYTQLHAHRHICSPFYHPFNTLFPFLLSSQYTAEWWVHSRPHSNGHQLHFDSDETRIMAGRTPQHPIVSTVLYLR